MGMHMMATMDTGAADTRAELGRVVRSRRHALGLTIRDATAASGLSDQTWANVEAGKKVSDRTLAMVERAMDWPIGSVDAFLIHGDVPPIEPTAAEPTGASSEVVAELQALRDQIKVLSETVDRLVNERAGQR